MKLQFKILILFSLLTTNNYPNPLIELFNLDISEITVTESDNLDSQNFVHIKVLLTDVSISEHSTWHISCNDEISLCEPKSSLKKNWGKEVTIGLKNGLIYLDGKLFKKSALQIEATNNANLIFNNKEYQGSFLIIKDGEKFLLINKVELENYIYSVLRTESWPGWPLEINKAFAIASRSYVIAKLLETKKIKSLYHVKNTNLHQTYQGTHKIERLRQAVEETKGILLAHNNKPILAMFDSCCGGIIPAKMKGVDFKNCPYLARAHECDHCKTCKLYSWKIEYTKKDFEDILRKELPKIKNCKKITVHKDDAGIVQRVNIYDISRHYYLSGKKFYSLFSSIKSFAFDISQELNKVILKGNGFGHHLGICQWGAKKMIDDGWNFKQVLQFYYPGTNFIKIKT